MQSIPQIRCELNQLSHVQVQYWSTLVSYQTTSKIMELMKQNLRNQIQNRFQQMKHFSTQQGIGLRKIMLEHYHRLHLTMSEEQRICDRITSIIYQRHKSMQNSLTFIEPMIKQIQHKQRVLNKQFDQIREKIEKLEQKKHKTFSKSFLTNQSEKIKHTYDSILLQKERTQTQRCYQRPNPAKQAQFSLFSIRKFENLQTKGQFEQIRSFLQLKREQIQQFLRIQKQLTQKTVRKMFMIFEQTLGKGLQQMEANLLGQIRKQKIAQPDLIPSDSQLLSDRGDKSLDSSVDLHCYETLEQIMKNQRDYERIRNVKKRLYSSSHVQGVELTQSIEQKNSSEEEQMEQISPSFNYIPPLILERHDQIRVFSESFQDQTLQRLHYQQSRQESPYENLYGSFSKQNFNFLNINQN